MRTTPYSYRSSSAASILRAKRRFILCSAKCDDIQPPSAGHVHFIGIGGSGLGPLASVARLRGWSVSGSDQAPSSRQIDLLRTQGITVAAGGHSKDNLAPLLAAPPGPRLVVASSAVPPSNPEVVAARAAGIEVLGRDGWLPRFTEDCCVLAVAGAHGKTTTASMLAFTLRSVYVSGLAGGAARGLMAVVGAAPPQFPPVPGGGAMYLSPQEAGARPPLSQEDSQPSPSTSGRPAAPSSPTSASLPFDLVVEADEYKGAFLGLAPFAAALTSADHDHVDCYPDPSDASKAFLAFCKRCRPGGMLLVCGDDEAALGVAEEYGRWAAAQRGAASVFTYGMGPGVDFQVSSDDGQRWQVVYWGGGAAVRIGEFETSLPGRHNALNATAAHILAAATLAGRWVWGGGLGDQGPTHTGCPDWHALFSLPAQPAKDSSTAPHRDAPPDGSFSRAFGIAAAHGAAFTGADRRFQLSAVLPLGSDHLTGPRAFLYDDYAHHPTEIRASLDAAASRHPGALLVLVLQPHTFSRLQHFLPEFAASLTEQDPLAIFILPVFAAREDDPEGSAALQEQLLAAVRSGQGAAAAAAAAAVGLSPSGAREVARAVRGPHSCDVVVMVMGAGDCTRFTDMVRAELQPTAAAAAPHSLRKLSATSEASEAKATSNRAGAIQ